jgi:hypothetical protein
MHLIGVARARGKLSEIPRNTLATCEIQQALETQHGLKHLRTVTDRRRQPALELAAADSKYIRKTEVIVFFLVLKRRQMRLR